MGCQCSLSVLVIAKHTAFQVRDAVVAEGGIPVLILFASQADATVGFRECLMALAKISEDR